jgi:hypothetical protein
MEGPLIINIRERECHWSPFSLLFLPLYTGIVKNERIMQLAGKEPLDLVQNAMGTLGPWHIVIAVALSLVKFPVAWHQLSIVFLAPPVNFTCISPRAADNQTMFRRCLVDLGNDTLEKCTDFHYDRSIFRETIITQVAQSFSLR